MKEAFEEANREILAVIESMGGSTSRYKKERKKGVRALISDIYSPPRVTAAAKMLPELRCIPGMAFDLTTTDEQGRPWDLEDRNCRERARRYMEMHNICYWSDRRFAQRGVPGRI